MPEKTENLGGGSGGGGGTGMDGSGNNLQSCKKTYQIAGNQVVLLSRKSLGIPTDDDAPPVASNITLLAAGGPPFFDDDGKVDIRGTKGVRITAGGPALPLISPDSTDDSTDGVDIEVDQKQSIKIHRGFSITQQMIEMSPNKITIDAGFDGELTLRAGMSQIVINQEGITIFGFPLVKIN